MSGEVRGTSGPEPAEIELKDLRVGGPPTVFVARVVSATYREVVRKSDGGRRPVLSGLITDGTATIRFTWWDPPREGVERGTILRAANAQVQEFRGHVEVSFNWRTKVEPASESDLPTVSPEELPLRPLGELRPRDDGMRVEGRILEVRPKPVTVRGERRLVFEGLLGDGSAVRPFTAWSDFGLRPGEVVRVSGLYVREFRGRPQLSFDDRSHVERIERPDLPTAEELALPRAHTVSELERERGGDHVSAEGLVVGLLPASGVVYRCPSCSRVLTKGLCRIHGAATGVPDLRARVVVDDGTGAMTVNLGRELTERLAGRRLEEFLMDLRAQPDPSRIEEELFDRLFGRSWRVEGRATSDDFGVSFFPDRIEEVHPDVGRLTAAARSHLGGGPP